MTVPDTRFARNTSAYVSNGADAWGTSAENGLLLLNTIVGPDVLDLVIKDQQYSTDFRFAIRVLSKKDDI